MEFERAQQVTYLPCSIKKAFMQTKTKYSAASHNRNFSDVSSASALSDQTNSCLMLPSSSSTDPMSAAFDNSHVFHLICLSEWLNVNYICPICNLTIEEDLTALRVTEISK